MDMFQLLKMTVQKKRNLKLSLSLLVIINSRL